MINITGEARETYYIVFKPSSSSFWWLRFLKEGFGHCYVICDVNNNSLVLNHHGYKISTTFIEIEPSLLAKNQADDFGYNVLEFTNKADPLPTYRFNMSCVSLVICVVGIRCLFALTPHSLYSALLKLGAKEV